jgi:ABC-type multidrug transport system ATPase subunit
MILQTKELTKFYRGKKAIERININVPKNSIYALIGLNGAGKSTLINIICGFLSQSSGSILFKEKDISSDKK